MLCSHAKTSRCRSSHKLTVWINVTRVPVKFRDRLFERPPVEAKELGLSLAIFDSLEVPICIDWISVRFCFLVNTRLAVSFWSGFSVEAGSGHLLVLFQPVDSYFPTLPKFNFTRRGSAGRIIELWIPE